MKREKKTVAIIGLGLLGASLALALKKQGSWHVAAWTRNAEVRARLLANGSIDATAEKVEEVLSEAGICVLCMPVPEIGKFCREHAGDFPKGSVVSDVGSVKGVVMREARPALEAAGVAFIGGHPMAGSEKSGPDAARDSLFENAVVFLTPGEEGSDASALKPRIEELKELWQDAGAHVHEIGCDVHDELLARSSHLPHALAWTLALTALEQEGQEKRRLAQLACASSFRDMTRVACSSPDLWTGIFQANREGLLEAIGDFKARLSAMEALLRSGQWDALREMMENGRQLREKWAESRSQLSK